jgi:hypothetical protein
VEAAPALARALLRHGSAELARLRRIRGAHRRTAQRIARAQAILALAAALCAAQAQRAEALSPFFLDPSHPFGLSDLGVGPRPVFADLDGDGDLDALVGTYNLGIVFFENTGTRRVPDFAPYATNPFGIAGVGLLAVPALADIDGDGDLDLFSGSFAGDIQFFENTGSASAPAFGAASTGAFGISSVPAYSAPSFADLDGDGDLDALVGELEGHVVLFPNTGTATAPAFGAGSSDPFGLPALIGIVVPNFVDIDGDGDLDALSGTAFGNTVFSENAGTATNPAFVGDVGSPFGLVAQPLAARPGFADLDADGDLDAVIGDISGALLFYRNSGTRAEPAFRPASQAFGLASVSQGAPDLGDLDGDGDLDVLSGASDGSLGFSENTGTKTSPRFAASTPSPFGLASAGAYSTPAFGDLDGDGDLDLLVGDATGAGFLLFFENTGTAAAPAFGAAQTDPFCAGSLGDRPSPAFLDLDEDGDLDLMIGYDDGRLDFCRNEGTPLAASFPSTDTNPFGLSLLGNNLTLAFADIVNDGKLEGVLGQADGALLVAFNSQSASLPFFVPTPAGPLGLGDVGEDSSPSLADVDGDGDFDALVGASSGYHTFFENLAVNLICPGAPRTDCTQLEVATLRVDERKAGKEKLALKLAVGGMLAQEDFGNPLLAGGTELGLCVYDDAGERVANLGIERAGELCGAKPCWSALGGAPPDGKGYAYKDKAGTAQGVTSLSLKAGPPARAKVQAAASNNAKKGRSALPTGIAAALVETTSATLQLHLTGGTCVSAELTEIRKQEPDFFKAR